MTSPETLSILRSLWPLLGLSSYPTSSSSSSSLPPLERLVLDDGDPILSSSFKVDTAAQVTIAGSALAASLLGELRGLPPQQISVSKLHATIEAVGWFSINGRVPPMWDAFSGLYRTLDDSWVRLHANFRHHREGILRLLGLQEGEEVTRQTAEEVIRTHWRSLELEQAAAEAGLVATAFRSFEEWDASPQGRAVSLQPLFKLERIGEASPLPLPPLVCHQGASHPLSRPLEGVKVLDLTRVLAGPVGGRTLAGYGADVMLINAPHLPNIEAIADTSRGKLSALLDLRQESDQSIFKELLSQAHVMIQGYRPGAIEALGFGPSQVSSFRPGIIYVSLSAYGTTGPWSHRRGFDSLVQTAMGFNHAEGQATRREVARGEEGEEGEGEIKPRPLPMQILDEATGYLIAFCVSAALIRQQQEGGSWHVQLSLAQTGHWLRNLGRVHLSEKPMPDFTPYIETSSSGFGELQAIKHSAIFEHTPVEFTRPSMPPGSHLPSWT